MMTERGLAGVLLKLLGVYFLVLVAASAVQLVDYFQLDWEQARLVLATNLLTIVVLGAASTTLLLNTSGLAKRLFPERDKDLGGLPSGDQLQTVVLVGVGVFLVAEALPVLARDLGTLFWYSGAERQEYLEDLLSSLMPSILESVMRIGIGSAIALNPRSIVAWIGRVRKSGAVSSNSPEPERKHDQ